MEKVKPKIQMMGEDSISMFTARAMTLRSIKEKLCLLEELEIERGTIL